MSIGEIPYGTYEVEIGESFAPVQRRRSHTASSPPDGNFHTLKYDFKPKSVASEQETYISIAENRDVDVVVPNEGLDHITVYKGSKKPIKGDKECILIFDHNTRQCRLEKLASNISVKKTRDNNVEDEDVIKEKIQQMRLLKPERQSHSTSATGLGLHSTDSVNKSADMSLQFSPPKHHRTSPGKGSGGELNTSFSGILAEEAATSPSAHSSGSSSSGSSSDSSSSSSSDEEDEAAAGNKAHRKHSGRESNSDDDEHVQAIEKIMSEANQPPPVVQNPPPNDRDGHHTSVVLNDLYMSDDNPSGSESD